jgi:quinol monooxygenase YgiN
MAITRINHFEAKPGSEEKLHAFLQSVIATIRGCAGSLSCRLLRSTESPEKLCIIEEWESIEAHQAAAKAIPKEMMAEAMALFGKPPSGAYYRD